MAKLGQRSDEIIHDMGNPLTILTCCIELLQTKVDEMKPEADNQWMETLGYIGMIKKSIQHCCGPDRYLAAVCGTTSPRSANPRRQARS